MDNTIKLAVQLNDGARARSTQRRIRRAQFQAVRQRAGSATYVGFDADSEKCTVRTASGEIHVVVPCCSQLLVKLAA